MDESAAEYSMDFVNVSTADLSPTMPPLKQQMNDSPKLSKEPMLGNFRDLKSSSAPSLQQQTRYDNVSGNSTPYFPTAQPTALPQQLGSDPLTESVAKSFLASQVRREYFLCDIVIFVLFQVVYYLKIRSFFGPSSKLCE